MGEWDIVDQILDYIPKINFDNTSTEVSLFETTIRYLGGLLSGKARESSSPRGPCAPSDSMEQPMTSSPGLSGGTSIRGPR